MVIGVLIRAALIYVGYLIVRKIWNSFNIDATSHINNSTSNSTNKNRNDDIVEAEYTVLDEKDSGE